MVVSNIWICRYAGAESLSSRAIKIYSRFGISVADEPWARDRLYFSVSQGLRDR
ncbi:MAG: hypothetical protein QXQ57_01370 [Sulfolobales archaeon]